MIISRLNGGLGNQLFQYAAARALAISNKTALYFDLSLLNEHRPGTTKRSFALEPFQISAKLADTALVHTIENRSHISRLLAKCGLHTSTVYREPHYHFDPTFLKKRGNVLVTGYMQSSRYFSAVSNTIREDLLITGEFSPETIRLQNQMKSAEAVSVHIRRGDYISDAATHQQHGVCSMAYYKNAISILATKCKAIHLFVFSDDMPWVRQHFTSGFPTTFVDHNDDLHSYEDLHLMSCCKHNIIANSSFSWWAAWRNNHPDKIVVAPAKWFGSSNLNTVDLVPEEWIRI